MQAGFACAHDDRSRPQQALTWTWREAPDARTAIATMLTPTGAVAEHLEFHFLAESVIGFRLDARGREFALVWKCGRA